MKIYTRTGDDGETALYGSGRVGKDHIRMQAIGMIDELNSIIGVVRAEIRREKRKEYLEAVTKLDYVLRRVQNELFTVGADLATTEEKARESVPQVGQEHVEFLEKTIDVFSEGLPELKQFILPGISVIAAQLHYARTVCRRAERVVLALGRRDAIGDQIIPYLNRMSDCLFTLARWINQEQGEDEYLWEK